MQLTNLPLKVVQNNKIVCHLPCEYSRILLLAHVAEKLLQTPVRGNGDSLLVGVQLSKVTINRLKELLESKIRQ